MLKKGAKMTNEALMDNDSNDNFYCNTFDTPAIDFQVFIRQRNQ